MSLARTSRALLGVTALLVAVAGCSMDAPAKKETAASSPTASSSTAAAPPPAPPPRHACYNLAFADAVKPTSTAPPVACSTPHTAATIYVGTVNPVVDGHLVAIDSDRVQQQIATRCRARLAAVVGGDQETRRLSRLTVVWFSPSLEQSDKGARWYRCDVVAIAGPNQLAPLPRSVRNVLVPDNALDRFGTCGTSSPAAPRFQRVICSQRHSWRARATIDLPANAKYLGKAAGAAAESTCHDIEARLASDSLKLQWSFEWPTRAQWNTGQRFGYCWTPDPA